MSRGEGLLLDVDAVAVALLVGVSRHSYHREMPAMTDSKSVHASAATHVREHISRSTESSISS